MPLTIHYIQAYIEQGISIQLPKDPDVQADIPLQALPVFRIEPSAASDSRPASEAFDAMLDVDKPLEVSTLA